MEKSEKMTLYRTEKFSEEINFPYPPIGNSFLALARKMLTRLTQTCLKQITLRGHSISVKIILYIAIKIGTTKVQKRKFNGLDYFINLSKSMINLKINFDPNLYYILKRTNSSNHDLGTHKN